MSSDDAFNVPVGTAYAMLYTVLVSFTILAVIAAGFLPVPSFLQCCVASAVPTFAAGGAIPTGASATGKMARRVTLHTGGGADFFLAARNSSNSRAIALSFFASGMGAWVVYGATEMGANPELSWLGVLGYSGASAFPAIVVCIIGPRIRKMTGEKAFCTTDYGLARYGRVMQLAVAVMSVFYMFIYIVSELTSISNIYALMVDKSTWDGANMAYTTGIAVSLAVFTWFYTSLAGLPASITTDKFQGVLMFLLVFIVLIAACAKPENRITKEEFAVASNWTTDGLTAAVTLFIAILSAEMFNQGTWQRVWAAESVPAMRKGFLWGSFLVFLLMMFFGIMGMISYANDPLAFDTFQKFYYLAFFELLRPLANFWHVVVLIVVTALAASSVDSLQTAIAAIFSSDFVRLSGQKGGSGQDWKIRLITRILLVLINIPAVIMSSKRYDVISLFLVADLVCATAVLPVYLGLMTKDWGFIAAPTELGALLGMIGGIATVLVIGALYNFNEAVNPITGETIATGPFSYFWLTNSYQCALCGIETMITFIVTPLMGGFFCLFFSKLDVMIRGERARQPIFKFGENDVAGQYILDAEDTSESSSDSIKHEVNEDSAVPDVSVENVSDTAEGAAVSAGKDDFEDEEAAY
mmetsp:Transcript_20820/g.45417  ORF Transcript_20820/g.45417 Transcript_20820/m.45417 type:complete len:640 (+) Transcript_20820:256-2175(+)